MVRMDQSRRRFTLGLMRRRHHDGDMRLWRVLFSAVHLSTLMSTLPAPAGAELVTPQEAPWGLATEGLTGNIDRWVTGVWSAPPECTTPLVP